MKNTHASPRPPGGNRNINECGAPYKQLVPLSDDWFVVYKIRNNILAISEPRYYQGNFSYLVVGERKALLIDAGATAKHDIAAVVNALTAKPVAVLPTHLHFDHLGGLARFADVWLPDTPALAKFKQADGTYHIPATYTFGYFEQLGPAVITPSRLICLDSVIDLGGVILKMAHAPGHSPDGVVVYDQTDNVLFTGDYLYPKNLYSSDTAAYAATPEKILALTNEDTLLLGAHAYSLPGAAVPAMPYSYLQDLKKFFADLASGTAQRETSAKKNSNIKSARCYKVNNKISFLEEIVWADGTAFKH